MSLLHLGRGIFGADFGSVAFCLKSEVPRETQSGMYRRLFDHHVDVRPPNVIEARFQDRTNGSFWFPQARFRNIPGCPIAYWLSDALLKGFERSSPISSIGKVLVGLQTGDNERFIRYWHEVSFGDIRMAPSSAKWVPYVKGGEYRKWYGNRDLVLDWKDNGSAIISHPSARPQNRDYYFREGITYTNVSSGAFSARFVDAKGIFDQKGSMIFVEDGSEPRSVLALLLSKVGTRYLEILCPTIDFNPGSVGQMPVIGDAGKAVAAQSQLLVQMGQSDWDAYETSWDFSTLHLLAPENRAQTLKDTYTRLRARWRAMTEEMQRLEERNNRIFIDAYGLQGELTPEVPLDEITLTCNAAYRYGGQKSEAELEMLLLADTMRELVSYSVGCMFGRYSLDEPGLILASQGASLKEFSVRVPNPRLSPDRDNVIPILDGDWFADDIAARFRRFLRVAFGEGHFQENLAFVEQALGKDIRKYFTRDFFNDHVKLYKRKPIYWLFSSPKGTFNALIYMHRYSSDTMSIVLNNYLREFRSKLEVFRKAQEALSISADASPVQKTKALKQVEATAREIEEIDAWERDVLFPLATQKIEIDLDGGVKANYPKFGAALKPIKGINDSDD